MVWVVAAFGSLSIILLFLGVRLGMMNERKAWVGKAMRPETPSQSAHHCEGEYYYVLTESFFLQTYRLREKDNPCSLPE